jgi:hypothetical protein
MLVLLNYNLIKKGLDLSYILNILILLTLSSFSICLIAFLLIITIKHQVSIFSLLIFGYYAAISMKGDFSKYMIFGQSILIKHYYYNINYEWSFSFTILFSTVVYLILRTLLLRRDIL